MNTENYVEKLNRLSIFRPRGMTRIGAMLVCGGEDGVLLWLEHCSEAYARDIIDHFGLTAGRVANITRKLEERGYIRRESDAEDQRRARITLTPEGHDRAAVIYREMSRRHRAFVEQLGEEAPCFLQTLDRMTDLAERGEPPFQE